MIVYTAEDFAGAVLATRDTDGVARRMAQESDKPWRASWIPDYDWLSDEEMAAGGWTPVVGSRVTEHTLRDSQEKAARKRERLVDHIADQDRVIRRRNDEIAVLRMELADAQAPLSLDTLAAAWEAAEVPTDDAPMQQGDVYISTVDRNDRGRGYLVAAAGRTGTHMHFKARILSRAPREPWQDLADELDDTPSCIANEALAQRLHAQGWRKTGGGDDE